MKTKAAVLYEIGKPLVIEELQIPALQRGQVLVKVLCSGVCHSQLKEIKASEITIPLSFTAECAENAEALENPSVDWNALKLCALGDLRGDKSVGF